MSSLRDLIFDFDSKSVKKRRLDDDLSSSSCSSSDRYSREVRCNAVIDNDADDDKYVDGKGDDQLSDSGDNGIKTGELYSKNRLKYNSAFLAGMPLISDKKGSIGLLKKHNFPPIYLNSPEIVHNLKARRTSDETIEGVESTKYAPGISDTFLFHQSMSNNTKSHGKMLKSLFFECFYGGDFEGAIEIFKMLNNLVSTDANYVTYFAQILNETTEKKSSIRNLAKAIFPIPKHSNRGNKKKLSTISMSILLFFTEIFVCNNDINTAISFLQMRANSFEDANNSILLHFLAILVIIKSVGISLQVFDTIGRHEDYECPKIIDIVNNPLKFGLCVKLLKMATSENYVNINYRKRPRSGSSKYSGGDNNDDDDDDDDDDGYAPLSDLSSEDELDNLDRFRKSHTEKMNHKRECGGDYDMETLKDKSKLLLIEIGNTLKAAIVKTQDDLDLNYFYSAYLYGNDKAKEGKKIANKLFKQKLKALSDESNEIERTTEFRKSLCLYTNYMILFYESRHLKLHSFYEYKLKEHIIHFATSDSTDIDTMYIALLLYKKGDLDKVAYIQTLCTYIEKTHGSSLINVSDNVTVTSNFNISSENMSSIMLRWSLWRILATLVGHPMDKYQNTDDRIKSSSDIAGILNNCTNRRRNLLSNRYHDCHSIFDVLNFVGDDNDDDDDDDDDDDATVDDSLHCRKWWLSCILSPLPLGNCVSYITDVDVEKVIVTRYIKVKGLTNKYITRKVENESDDILIEIFNVFRKAHKQSDSYVDFKGVAKLHKYIYEDSRGIRKINAKVAVGIKQNFSPLNSKHSMLYMVGDKLKSNMNKQSEFKIQHSKKRNDRNLHTFRYLGDIHLEMLAYQVIFHIKLSRSQDSLFVVRCCQIICEHALQELKVKFSCTTTAHRCIKFLEKNRVNFKRACRIAFLVSLFES